MAILEIFFNDKSLDAIPLQFGKTCKIGRDTASDVVIDEMVVSFHHAKIESHGKGFFLVDLDSENGTFLNKKKINSVWLNDNDTISVGNHILKFSNPLIIDTPKELEKSVNETIPMDCEKVRGFCNGEISTVNKLDSNITAIMVLVLLPDQRKLLALGEKPIILGKAPNSDIVVQGLGVGKNAATIEKLADGWYLRQVGGLARPRVNGEFSKKPLRLKEFDIISLGKTRIQVWLDSDRLPQ